MRYRRNPRSDAAMTTLLALSVTCMLACGAIAPKANSADAGSTTSSTSGASTTPSTGTGSGSATGDSSGSGGGSGSSSGSASDHYVSTTGSDSNAGTAAKPWRTLGHAASAVQPGDTVHVLPGMYAESVVTTTSGTASARIRFISDSKWGSQIVAGSAEADWQNRGDYVDIMGFDVTGASPNGIENLGSNGRIIGNHVHDVPASCNSNGGSGINNANYSASDDDIVANVVHDVRQPAGCSAAHGVGIYHSNLRGHVLNNLSFNNGTVGIQLWHAATSVIVANNTVFNNAVNGIVVGAGDAPGGITNDYTLVVNNISVHNADYGIQEFGTTGTHNQFLNNLVYANSAGNMVLLHGAASGTITAEAGFVNYTGLISGDYHLAPGSPAIDAGTNQNAPTSDINGGARPQGKGWDIGAYEAGAAAASWPWM